MPNIKEFIFVKTRNQITDSSATWWKQAWGCSPSMNIFGYLLWPNIANLPWNKELFLFQVSQFVLEKPLSGFYEVKQCEIEA